MYTHADFYKFYFSSLCELQIQMYQLSRLLHDYHRELYNHLEENEISPSLYAAPWFLTLFASQFPLGFVARVFGKRCLCPIRTVLSISPRSLSMKIPEDQESPKYYSNVVEKNWALTFICVENLENTVFRCGSETDSACFSRVLSFWVLHLSLIAWGHNTEKGTQLLCC